MKKNVMLLGAGLDCVNSATAYMQPDQLYGALQQQALMVSVKEIFGWLTLACMGCILLFMLKESTLRPRYAIHPRYRVIRRYIKREVRALTRVRELQKDIV